MEEVKVDQLTMTAAMAADDDRSGSPRSILVAVPMSFSQQTAPLSISELEAPLSSQEVKAAGATYSLGCVPAACNYMEVSLPSSTLSSLLNQVYARHHIVPQPTAESECDESDSADMTVTDNSMDNYYGTHTSEVPDQMEASSALQLNQMEALDEDSNAQIYKCMYCGKCFSKARGLSVHIKTHSSNQKPSNIKYCKKCLTVPVTSSGKRPGTARRKQNSIYCKKCLPIAAKPKREKPKKIKVKRMKESSSRASQKIANHPECGKVRKRKRLRSRNHKCTFCNKRFVSRCNLIEHTRIHTGEKPFKCSHCDKSFSRASYHTRHERIHTEEKPYLCRYCSKQFFLARSLEQHELRHMGKDVDRSLLCSVCGKHFCRPRELEKHEVRHHHGACFIRKKAFECTECDKRFTTRNSLKMHRRNHTGDKPYKCSFCDKSFAMPNILKDHLNTHTGYKPHICTYCGRGFACSGSLTKHVRLHTGEKPFKCKYCDKCFNQSSALSGHEISNHPECGKARKEKRLKSRNHKCTFCNNLFSSLCSLIEHTRMHTGEKPFKCSHCDKSFSRASNLKQHERMHTGEKPYPCRYCNKSFSVSSNRLKHERAYHADVFASQ